MRLCWRLLVSRSADSTCRCLGRTRHVGVQEVHPRLADSMSMSLSFLPPLREAMRRR